MIASEALLLLLVLKWLFDEAVIVQDFRRCAGAGEPAHRTTVH
ncbi:hypothetical protein [Geochorda subterranea]|uniref:Uncharacterized protein n=1 Tax=Geochorda subterranea TaxID=3109564 RepID=A0ABZ1BQ96_9FIRM|nr:hypothetical protein [Limnochorda sp. LNt]WRP14967.1 hypothetical protein VLY81_01990 [Limnochorda sp. LNt]